MNKIQLSATAIQTFKACPYRYYLKYVKHIKPAEEKEALRFGTNWHTALELLAMEPNSACPVCADQQSLGGVCLICNGTGKVPADPMESVVRVLDEFYARRSPGAGTVDDLEVEKIKILYGAQAYRWYYQNEKLDVVHCEEQFNIKIPSATGRTVRGLTVVGKIDKRAVTDSGPCVVEHKSTGSSLDTDSSYWSRLHLDTQTTLYPFATRLLSNGEATNGVLYDVFKKPGISPKLLSQGDTKKFIEDGMYCGVKFVISGQDTTIMEGEPPLTFTLVNGHNAEIKPGAKEGTFAIRETPEMYGARLLQDIASRPEHYFARKEVGRTDADIEAFHKELLSIHSSIKTMSKNNSWYHCEDSCEATYRCDFCDICYNHLDPDGELPSHLIRKEKN